MGIFSRRNYGNQPLKELFHCLSFTDYTDPILLFNNDGMVIECNNICIGKYGRRNEILQYIAEGDQKAFSQYFLRCLSGQSIQESVYFTINETQTRKLIQMYPIKSNNAIIGGYLIAKKLMDNDDERLAEKYRAIVENSLAGIYIIDNDKYVYANETYKRMLEIEKSIEQEDVLSFVHEEDHPLAREKIKDIVSGKETSVQYNCRLICGNGDFRYLNIYLTKFNMNGKMSILGLAIDEPNLQKSNQNISKKEMPNDTSEDLFQSAMNDPSKMRKFYRLNFEYPIIGSFTLISVRGEPKKVGKSKILVKDISAGGIRFTSNMKLPTNIDFVIKVFISIGEISIEYPAQIIWRNQKEGKLYEYGFEFLIDEKDQEQLLRFINLLQGKVHNGNKELKKYFHLHLDDRKFFKR